MLELTFGDGAAQDAFRSKKASKEDVMRYGVGDAEDP